MAQPNHLVVSADSAELFECPFVTIEDAGTARFNDAEVIEGVWSSTVRGPRHGAVVRNARRG